MTQNERQRHYIKARAKLAMLLKEDPTTSANKLAKMVGVSPASAFHWKALYVNFGAKALTEKGYKEYVNERPQIPLDKWGPTGHNPKAWHDPDPDAPASAFPTGPRMNGYKPSDQSNRRPPLDLTGRRRKAAKLGKTKLHGTLQEFKDVTDMLEAKREALAEQAEAIYDDIRKLDAVLSALGS